MSTDSIDNNPPALSSPLLPQTLTSVTALARFEFEPGRGNDGTKVILVEWQDDDKNRHTAGSWQVSWTGKKTSFPADDNPSDNTRRLYFLLPPGQNVPPAITIAYTPPKDKTSGKQAEPMELSVQPLPAIFTPELGATAKASGKKGVLHTIWAKKRLQMLAKEIRLEEEFNLEGIALEMALSERQWIEQNFGIAQPPQKPANLDLGALPKMSSPPISPGPQSPRSPGGRRLTDKLKGLSLVTNEKDISGINTPTREANPLSPEAGDVAYGSFRDFKGDRPSRPAANTGPKKMVAQAPPAHIQEQQSQSIGASLSSVARGEKTTARPQAKDTDDLFAVALSPRSPDAPKSPFSMSSADVGAFAKIKGIQTQRTF